MTDIRYALRPEARPVPYDSLNRSQLAAMRALVAALTQAVDDAHRPSDAADGALAIDTNRASRLFFVSGEPGSGKSSLYTTLRYITDPTTVRPDRRSEDIRKGYCKLPNVSTLRNAIRWLEPIDLEVSADEEENLLAAVLVRIFDAIDRSSTLTASKECRDAMDRLDELANDIGIAWDGNLKKRAASLDPDNFSQETLRAQRARLNTNNRLRSALETLLKTNCYGLNDEALFVLPIDDFYLKPKASLELLRLLRMVSVPRLFFLIMGDMKTIEALFFEKALADWTAVAGPHVFQTLRNRTTQEVLPRAREMRARYLRKLIPAGQRATILWTEWDEALDFTPPLPAVPGLTLRDLLSEIKVTGNNGQDGLTLFRYLVSPPPESNHSCEVTGNAAHQDPKESNKSTVKKFREAYSGLQILDATPREVLDLWLHLWRYTKTRRDPAAGSASSEGDEYLRSLIEYAIPAMEEQDFLTEEDQEVLRFAFPGSARDTLQLRTDRLHVVQRFGLWQPSQDKNTLVRQHFDWRLGILDSEAQMCRCHDTHTEEGNIPSKNALAHGHLDWTLCMLDHKSKACKGRSREKEKKSLPPRQAAWLILLHDLAWMWRPDSVLENLVQRLLSETEGSSRPVEPKGALDTEHPGWAWYVKEGGDTEEQGERRNGDIERGHTKDRQTTRVWCHFPFPQLRTFRQLDRFLKIWSCRPAANQNQRGVRPVDDDDDAARKWAMAAWIVQKESEDVYERYVTLLDESRDQKDNAEWYKKCILSLHENGDADDKSKWMDFASFAKALFNGHRVLIDRAVGSQE